MILLAQESNNASTCQASPHFSNLAKIQNYREALSSLAEFKENGYWKTIEESIHQTFGEGLDNRLSWFLAPLAVTVLIEYSESMPKEIGITQLLKQ